MKKNVKKSNTKSGIACLRPAYGGNSRGVVPPQDHPPFNSEVVI